MKKRKFRVGLIQTSVGKSSEQIFSFVQKQLRKLAGNCEWIVLPEVWLSGFKRLSREEEVWCTEETLKDLKAYAKKNQVYLSASHLQKTENGFENVAYVLSPKGKICSSYSKVHLFKQGDEHKRFKAGSSFSVSKSEYGKFALAICYDIRFPEMLRKLALDGAQFFIIPVAWPKKRIDHFQTLLKARAVENQCYVIACNKVGSNEQGLVLGGHSSIYDPWGKKILDLGEKETCGIAEIDLDYLDEVRKSFPVLNMRRRDLY